MTADKVKEIMSHFERLENQIVVTARNSVDAIMIGLTRDLAILRSVVKADFDKTLKEEEDADKVKPESPDKSPEGK